MPANALPTLTRSVRLLGASLVLLGLAAGQEDVVTAELEAANFAKEGDRPEAAARHLYTALRALEEVGDEAKREPLRAAILAANATVDKTLERRIMLQQEATQRFEATLRKLMADGYPTTAQTFAQQLKAFDEELASRLAEEAEKRGEGRSKAEAKRDRAMAVLFALGEVMAKDEDALRRIKGIVKEVPTVGDWLDARQDVAVQYESLAKSYSQRRWVGIAWELVRVSYSLDRDGMDRKLYDKISAAVSKAAALERERRAAPTMAQFKDGHEKFGRSKKWKISGKLWRSPKPGRNSALVLSEERIDGDYRLEVSVRLPRPASSFQVVVAARGPDEYLVVHCERTFGSLGQVVLAHVRDGARTDLEGFRAQGVLDGFVPMKIDVTGDTVSLDYTEKRTVALPFARGDGLRYGFALPSTTKEKIQRDEAAEIRDLILTNT